MNKIKNLIVLYNHFRKDLICAFENETDENFQFNCQKCDEIESEINEYGFNVQYNCTTNFYELFEINNVETIKDYEISKNKKQKTNTTNTSTFDTAEYGRFKCIVKVA